MESFAYQKTDALITANIKVPLPMTRSTIQHRSRGNDAKGIFSGQNQSPHESIFSVIGMFRALNCDVDNHRTPDTASSVFARVYMIYFITAKVRIGRNQTPGRCCNR